MNSAVFVVLSALITIGACGTACPNVPTVNIDKARFEGKWYSIWESADPRLPCLHYNVEVTPDNNLKCTFLPYGLSAAALPKDANDITKGFNIAMDFPKMNGSNWSIPATDYDNYAVIFTCKEQDGVSYHSVTMWSRTPYLLPQYKVAIESVLDQYIPDYKPTLWPIAQLPLTCANLNLIVPVGIKLFKQVFG